MPEPIDLQTLHQAVLAQSDLIARLMAMFRDGDLAMTPDEGHEMLIEVTEGMRPEVLQRYLQPILRLFPTHSTED